MSFLHVFAQFDVDRRSNKQKRRKSFQLLKAPEMNETGFAGTQKRHDTNDRRKLNSLNLAAHFFGFGKRQLLAIKLFFVPFVIARILIRLSAIVPASGW